MAISRSPLPILEYDDSKEALLMPGCHKPEIKLPSRAVFAFLGDAVDQYTDANGTLAGEFVNVTKTNRIYQVPYQGQDICICRAPLGSAAAVQLLDWMIGHGVTQVIAAGSCGALTELPENAFLIPVRALRDEGTSYHYLPPSRFVETSPEIRQLIKAVLAGHDLPYQECTTWSTDGFFRETENMVAYRREEGCSVVEMECAALAACAQFRGIRFGQLLYTADTLANSANYDRREWGEGSVAAALHLSLEIASKMELDSGHSV